MELEFSLFETSSDDEEANSSSRNLSTFFSQRPQSTLKKPNMLNSVTFMVTVLGTGSTRKSVISSQRVEPSGLALPFMGKRLSASMFWTPKSLKGTVTSTGLANRCPLGSSWKG